LSLQTTGRSVLVVDDEPDLCVNMADILGDLGYRVDTAHDGPSALELVRRTPYDVALLDLRMPGMDGLELYHRIKELRAGTIAIVVTAFATTATTQKALAAGAWGVLPKPVDLPSLLRLVEQAIDRPLVLIVDDDRDLCANLWDLLRERGYRVDLAHDEEQAAAFLRDRAFHIVLLDLKLPGGSGANLLPRIRAASMRSRTILITGQGEETERLVAQVLHDGADAVCYKPFDIPRLLGLIGNEPFPEATVRTASR
jgi:DNA-binding response OmpR family regulator